MYYKYIVLRDSIYALKWYTLNNVTRKYYTLIQNIYMNRVNYSVALYSDILAKS